MEFSKMKAGAFQRDFEEVMQRLVDDLWDPEKVPSGKRGFTLKFTHTAKSREVGQLEMIVESVKLGKKLYPTVMAMDVILDKGLAVGSERNSEKDGHAGLFEHDGSVSDGVRTDSN